MLNWKAPGVQKAPKLVCESLVKEALFDTHETISKQLSKILNREKRLFQWLTLEETIFYQKDPNKGNAIDHF